MSLIVEDLFEQLASIDNSITQFMNCNPSPEDIKKVHERIKSTEKHYVEMEKCIHQKFINLINKGGTTHV